MTPEEIDELVDTTYHQAQKEMARHLEQRIRTDMNLLYEHPDFGLMVKFDEVIEKVQRAPLAVNGGFS